MNDETTNDEKNTRSLSRAPAFGLTLLIFAAVVAGVLLAQFLPPDLFGLRDGGAAPEAAATGSAAAENGTSENPVAEGPQLFTCGMHPNVIQEGPGQCPICGMDLTPMRDGGDDHAGHDHAGHDPARHEESAPRFTCEAHPSIVESEPGTCPIDGLELVEMAESLPSGGADPEAEGAGTVVRIDPAVVQNMNVRTEKVARRDLERPIRTVGYLEYDQQRMVTVTTKYSGWVEKVYVNYVGEEVRRGQPLFEIYSPELVQTEQELLSAIAFAEEMCDAPDDARRRALSMVESARTRLGYWDVSPEQIARLEETGEVFRTLEVTSPADGLVMKRMAGLEGMAVRPGMELFHIADLSTLWLSAELFEDQVAWVREGTPAQIELAYFPGESWSGRVRFLDPEFSEETRTMRVKIEVPNRDRRLRKGMYATVDLRPAVVHGAIAVPSQAILRTGRRDLVVLALGDGRFVPREVILGHEAEGWAEVRSGLEEGAEVVTSAQFLLDSESTVREAIQKMLAEHAGHAGHASHAGH